jgi:exopolysaccharide biosynthesis polyprenyl glycosylphosphotransferase
MLRQHQLIRMQVHQLMDACLFALGFWLAFELRALPTVIEFLNLPAAPPEDPYFWIFLFLIPAAPVILESQGFYNRPVLGPRWAMIWSLLRTCGVSTVLLILLLFFFQITFARPVVISFPLIAFSLVYIKEEILRAIYKTRMGRSQMKQRFLLAGTPDETSAMRKQIELHQDDALEVVATLNLNETTPEVLVQMLHDHSINGVLLSSRHTYFDRVEAFVKVCELEGVEAWLVADFFKTQISQPTFDEFYGRPVLVFRSAPDVSWQGFAKQVIDFVGAFAVLLPFSLVMIPVALIVKLTSPGPVFFRQQRAGLNGRPFTMLKFRTMVTNAEQLKQELAVLNEMTGPVFKVTNDPRVTPIGKWLRKMSIDEFPQLLNVLRGEMSLVGPRPLPVDEVARFDDMAHRRRLSVKPGLTCIWQVSGRNKVSDFREWVRLDLEYIDNWSLWLDIKILVKTVPVVLFGWGAK